MCFLLLYIFIYYLYFIPSPVFIRIEQRNLWKEFRKKENHANQPRFVFFIRDEQFCASIRVKGVLLQLWSELLTNRICYGLDRTLLAKRPMRKVRQCPTALATMECPRPGGMIPTVRSWLHLIVTVGLEKMGRLCKRVCVSLSPPLHTGTRGLARPCVVNLGRASLTLWESRSLDWTHTPRRARSVTDPSSITDGRTDGRTDYVNLYIR
jgi:hypothetical protein